MLNLQGEHGAKNIAHITELETHNMYHNQPI